MSTAPQLTPATQPAPATPPASNPPRRTPAQRTAARPAAPSPANAVAQHAVRAFGTGRGIRHEGKKIGIYGPGGVGKTELASLVTEIGRRPLFADIENSTDDLDVERVEPGIETFEELRAVLHNRNMLKDYDTIVIDSFTRLEELASDYAVRTIKHEKGHYVDSIEGYGFGKGYTHVYECFLLVLGDLDAIFRQGKWVIATMHECTANVPNPTGEDWIRYEPRLQSPTSGKASIRHKVKEWCGHLLFVGYDASVSKDGKATGSGTRTIYPAEMPTHWAKSRTLSYPIPYYRYDAELWRQLSAEPEQPQ